MQAQRTIQPIVIDRRLPDERRPIVGVPFWEAGTDRRAEILGSKNTELLPGSTKFKAIDDLEKLLERDPGIINHGSNLFHVFWCYKPTKNCTDLKLAQCIAFLQAGADPNANLSAIEGRPFGSITKYFFTPESFCENALGLLFSYGLSAEHYVRERDRALAEQADVAEQTDENLQITLPQCAHEVRYFQDFIDCFGHLARAYECAQPVFIEEETGIDRSDEVEPQYDRAIDHYYEAAKLLKQFTESDILDPSQTRDRLILEDYNKRFTTCQRYIVLCDDRYKETHDGESYASQLPRLSDTTMSTDSAMSTSSAAETPQLKSQG